MRKRLRNIIYITLLAISLLIIAIILIDWRVSNYGQNYVYNQIQQVPNNKVGLLLGTSKKISNGQPNLYFRFRIEAAHKLFESGKIEYILVSGDNATDSYNEPWDMKIALEDRGVPEDRIILDYAGFRTLDSVIRSQKVFGQDSITIISQEFHNKRAIYIAHANNIQAIAFNAQDLSFSSGFKTWFREKLARVKLFLDLYLLNTQPKFLGKSVSIDKD